MITINPKLVTWWLVIFTLTRLFTVSPGKSDHSMMNTTLSPSRSYDSQLNKLPDHPTPLSASKRSDYVVLVLFVDDILLSL